MVTTALMADLLPSLYFVLVVVFVVGCYLWFRYMVQFLAAGFDADRRLMFDELSLLMAKLPVRSVWVVGGDFNAEVGSRGVGARGGFG